MQKILLCLLLLLLLTPTSPFPLRVREGMVQKCKEKLFFFCFFAFFLPLLCEKMQWNLNICRELVRFCVSYYGFNMFYAILTHTYYVECLYTIYRGSTVPGGATISDKSKLSKKEKLLSIQAYYRSMATFFWRRIKRISGQK